MFDHIKIEYGYTGSHFYTTNYFDIQENCDKNYSRYMVAFEKDGVMSRCIEFHSYNTMRTFLFRLFLLEVIK